jgi:hypothetical protein
MPRKKKDTSKIVGREVSFEEFRESISFNLFKKSYQLLGVIAQAKVDNFIKSLRK